MCALKEYELQDNSQWRLLQREIRLLHTMQHPHVAELQAVFQEPQTSPPVVYLQLKWYAGGDCWSWLERERPCMTRRKSVLHHLAMGLQHMHLHGVAHGDVKLENLLISDQVIC